MTHFQHYLRLLIELHRLMKAGNDGVLADDIRDEMDNHWYCLTNSEIDRLEAISKVLYSLENVPNLSTENIGKYLVLL